jgi:hypothetical protein
LQTLTAADVRTFDDDAKKLLALMAVAEWRGYLSGSNHAIMHAPDGKTTISVSRNSLRGRSGRNAKAEFERWLKTEVKEAVEVIEHVNQLEQSPFGNLARANKRTVNKGDWAWRDGSPVGLRTDAAVEVKRNQDVVEWMNSRTAAQRATEGVLLYNDEAPLEWALFDTRGWPSLVGHGSGTDPERAYARYLELAPEDFPSVAPPEPEKETTDVATRYQCTVDECGKTFETRDALKGHTIALHSTKPWVCPVCDREFRSAGTKALHEATHNKETCPECGEEIVPHFMSRHLDKHEKARAAKEEGGKTHAEATVDAAIAHVKAPRPQAPEPAPVSPDVTLTSGDELAQIRAIVAGPLLAENERLKARVSELEAENARLATEREDAKARMQLILEAAQA